MTPTRLKWGAALAGLVVLGFVANDAGNSAKPRVVAVPPPKVTKVLIQHRTVKIVRHPIGTPPPRVVETHVIGKACVVAK